MRFLGLCLIPFLFSCSVFENEQDFEIHPPSIIGEWYLIHDEDGNPNFFHPSKIDTAEFERIITIDFFESNDCSINDLKPKYNRHWRCIWSIYAEENYTRFFLNLDFDYQLPAPTFFDKSTGILYEIIELSQDRLMVNTLGGYNQ
jgi:hypothetical protein